MRVPAAGMPTVHHQAMVDMIAKRDRREAQQHFLDQEWVMQRRTHELNVTQMRSMDRMQVELRCGTGTLTARPQHFRRAPQTLMHELTSILNRSTGSLS